MAPDTVLLQGPRKLRFLISEVLLYIETRPGFHHFHLRILSVVECLVRKKPHLPRTQQQAAPKTLRWSSGAGLLASEVPLQTSPCLPRAGLYSGTSLIRPPHHVQGHHMFLGIVLAQGPIGWCFIMSEVPLQGPRVLAFQIPLYHMTLPYM